MADVKLTHPVQFCTRSHLCKMNQHVLTIGDMIFKFERFDEASVFSEVQRALSSVNFF